jgi:hypothetical protein
MIAGRGRSLGVDKLAQHSHLPVGSRDGQAYRDDLLFLRDTFPRLDKSFTPEAQAQFRNAIEDLLARADSVEWPDFVMGVARCLASANNAHTMVVPFRQLRVAPIRVHWFSDGLHVIREASPGNLVGSRVVSIQDDPPDLWLARLQPFIGGNLAHCRALSEFFLVCPEALAASGRSISGNQLTIGTHAPDGSLSRCTLETLPEKQTEEVFPEIDPYIASADDGFIRWRQVVDRMPEIPLYLRQPHRNAWFRWLAEQRTMHIVIRRTTNIGTRRLSAVLDDAIERLASRKGRNAIVDLRFNSGGDFLLARTFCERLPAALPLEGRLFVIVNCHTFSAGLVIGALLKYYGSDRALIVGEPPGDRAAFWAEGGVFELPQTLLRVRCATGWHDWEHGCRDDKICPWFNLLYSVPAGSLEPAKLLPAKFADYASGRDAVIEAIVWFLNTGEWPEPA